MGYDIFVRNLPEDTTAAQLADFFAEAGKIIGAPRLLLGKGFAWITFDSAAAQTEAISWSGCQFGSRAIYVKHGKPLQNGIRSSAQEGVSHMPTLCEEVVQKMVAPSTGGIYVDGTFGRGGHSKAMLAALSATGKLHAFDLDPEAIEAGKELMAEDPRFTIHHAPFSSMKKILGSLGVFPGSVAGVFLDLGASEDASRGFRPEADGPLDLRFDNTKGVPASEFLKTVPHSELVRIIGEYGEVSAGSDAARRIADAICLARSRGELPTRTKSFAALVARAKGKEYHPMHPAKMTFQALRIHLNDEFGEIKRGMRVAFKLLDEGGRIGLLTWKSSEREIVDEVFRSLEAVRDKEPLLEWYQEQPNAPPLLDGPSLETEEEVRPSERELRGNSRCKSALLHILHKRNVPRLAHLEKQAYSLPGWVEAVAPVSSAEDKKEVLTKKTKRKKKPIDTHANGPEAPKREPKKLKTSTT